MESFRRTLARGGLAAMLAIGGVAAAGAAPMSQDAAARPADFRKLRRDASFIEAAPSGNSPPLSQIRQAAARVIKCTKNHPIRRLGP